LSIFFAHTRDEDPRLNYFLRQFCFAREGNNDRADKTMTSINHLGQNDAFRKNRHRHFFRKGETLAEREAWLENIENICQAAGTKFRARHAIDEQGNPGYEFGFPNISGYAAFVFNVFGDLEQPGGHIQTCTVLDDSLAYRQAFLLAASSHLAALGISHQWREHNGTLQFAFDRFSDRLMFQALIDQGTIDSSAKGLIAVREMQQRLGNHHSQFHRPELDL